MHWGENIARYLTSFALGDRDSTEAEQIISDHTRSAGYYWECSVNCIPSLLDTASVTHFPIKRWSNPLFPMIHPWISNWTFFWQFGLQQGQITVKSTVLFYTNFHSGIFRQKPYRCDRPLNLMWISQLSNQRCCVRNAMGKGRCGVGWAGVRGYLGLMCNSRHRLGRLHGSCGRKCSYGGLPGRSNYLVLPV